MDEPACLDFLAEQIGAAWQPPFRGEIFEYARKLDLQRGYAVKGELQMETLGHLLEPLRAIRDPGVRIVSVTGAVQTTKSLLADIAVPFWIEHDPGDTLWLLEDDPKAKLYADDRAMPLICSVPEIAALLAGVERDDKTKTKIKFRHMNLAICGLNEGNVQSLSWRNVIVDEKWLHAFDGLIRQAMDRTKQYPDTKKIILIGQGGTEDDDADKEHKVTDQRLLHYACPFCGKYQPFDLPRLRPEDFPLPALRGTYGGLSWDVNNRTRPGGVWNFDEVGKSAHHRCYFCDGRIEDRPEVRRRLNDSYRYFPKGVDPNAPGHPKIFPFPKAVGFQWSGEASMRVSFGDLAVKYLRAKIAAEEQGYRLPLQEYYQKDRGLNWSDLAEVEYKAIVAEPYDVNAAWPEEAFRPLIVDCQRDLKKFYYGVFAVALNGESRELARGIADSFKAIQEIQEAWKVKDQHVFMDCGYQMTSVLRECVKHGHNGQVKIGGKVRKIWLCWTGMKGSGQELFKHLHPRTSIAEYRIYSPCKWYDTNVGTKLRAPRSPWYEWSNLHCKDLLRARRDGDPGLPKFLTLPDTLPPTDENSHFAQMRAERRVETYQAGRKRAIWLPVKQTRPNHFWDIGAMLMAFMGIVGIIGSPDSGDQAPAQS